MPAYNTAWENSRTSLSPSFLIASLRLTRQEAPDQLLLGLSHALNLCPWLAGTLIPLVASDLDPLDRQLLARYFFEASAFLNAERCVPADIARTYLESLG